MKRRFSRSVTILTGLSMFCCSIAFGQDDIVTDVLTDTTAVEEEVRIPLTEEELPVVLSEIQVRSLQWANSLPAREPINSKLLRNDSILVQVDSVLTTTRNIRWKRSDARALINYELYWKDQLAELEQERDAFSGDIEMLQTDRQKRTNRQLTEVQARFLNDSVDLDTRTERLALDVIRQQDSINSEVEWRKDLLLTGLNRTVTRLVDVELLVEEIEQALTERETNIYTHKEDWFFGLDFKSFGLGDSLSAFNRRFSGEWKALKTYLQSKLTIVIWAIGFVFLTMALFYWLRRRLNKLDLSDLTGFQSSLVIVLKRPLSASLLFGLFVGSTFFANAPPLMSDLMILILLGPIINLHSRLLPRELMPYLWLFAALLVVRFIDGFMPQDTVGFRLLLLLFALIEWMALLPWIRKKREVSMPSRRLGKVIYFTLWVHWIAVSISIVANLFGYVDMARVFAESLVANLIGIIILYFSSIVLIGGLHFALNNDWFQKFNVIRIYQDYLQRVIARIVIFVAFFFWVSMLLRIFYVRRSVEDWFSSVFLDEISLGSITFNVSSIFFFVVIIWLSVLLSRALKVILNNDVLVRLPLNKGVPRMITAVTQFSIILLGILFAIRYIGMPLDQLTIIFSAFSVGIGFGLQNIFNNLVSGVILLFERPIQIGDTVEVGTLTGIVKSMGIRSSNIKTYDGAEVIVPNGQLISQEVINWTLSDRHRRIEVISGVAYGTDVHMVKELLLKVLNEHPDIMKNPAPLVLFSAMGESSLDFRLLFWTAQFDDWLRVQSEVVFAVHDILYANEIEIPFPQRDLHIRSIDGDIPIRNNQSDPEPDPNA